MSGNIIVKSYPNGIRIQLNNEISFDELLKECKSSFLSSANFFKNAKLAVSFEGRELSVEEERALILAIQEVCEIDITCIIGNDAKTGELFTQKTEELFASEELLSARFFRGTLQSGEHFESSDSIIVLGDVQKDAVLSSDKDVIILGKLYGEVRAGQDGNPHFIVALEWNPYRLTIANSSEYTPPKKSVWSKKNHLPMMAYLSQGHIYTKEIEFTEELLELLV